jgi:hypothetical protein
METIHSLKRQFKLVLYGTKSKKTSLKLTLNLDKTSLIKCLTYNSPQFLMSIGYEYIEESVLTKFLGLQIGSHLKLKTHVDQLVPKSSGSCYAVRALLHVSNIDTLKLIHFEEWCLLGCYAVWLL